MARVVVLRGGKAATGSKAETRKEKILEKWPDASYLKKSEDYKSPFDKKK